jgi:glycopeptide antibiotics resistance protein
VVLGGRLARAALVGYAALTAVALLWPSSDVQSQVVQALSDALGSLGVPDRLVGFDRLEVLMNAVIMVPLGFLGSAVFLGTGWRTWAAYGFVGSLVVELLQALVLPARQASWSDVVANTLGLLTGAMLFAAIGPMLRSARGKTENGE